MPPLCLLSEKPSAHRLALPFATTPGVTGGSLTTARSSRTFGHVPASVRRRCGCRWCCVVAITPVPHHPSHVAFAPFPPAAVEAVISLDQNHRSGPGVANAIGSLLAPVIHRRRAAVGLAAAPLPAAPMEAAATHRHFSTPMGEVRGVADAIKHLQEQPQPGADPDGESEAVVFADGAVGAPSQGGNARLTHAPAICGLVGTGRGTVVPTVAVFAPTESRVRLIARELLSRGHRAVTVRTSPPRTRTFRNATEWNLLRTPEIRLLTALADAVLHAGPHPPFVVTVSWRRDRRVLGSDSTDGHVCLAAI